MSDEPSTAPCASCPYLRSTPLGIWHPSEYAKLRAEDASEMGGATYGCHKADGSLCRGWLADQKRRGLPSIHLRIKLARSAGACAVYDAVDARNPDLYGSIAEMCEANAGREFPEHNPKARHLATRKRSAR